MTDSQERQPPVVQIVEPLERVDDSVIDLSYLFIVWLKWIWVPILMGAFGLYSGYRDLQAFSPQYVASVVVAPTGNSAETSQLGVSGLAAQFGLQISRGESAVSSFDRLQMMLGSVVFAEKLQEEQGIMQILYSGSWDAASKIWVRPSGENFEREQKRRAFLRQNLWAPPNLEDVGNYLVGALQFEPIGVGPFQQISVTHSDPEFALWLLTTAYFGADDMLREQDRIESIINQANLEAKLAVETNVQFQDALRGLLTNELSRDIMLDEALPYAARIIEPARIHNHRTEPNLRNLFGVPTVAFSGLGFLLITLIALFRRERRKG